ncbi:MAG: hypothetical protein HN356_02585, partial [Calditrichaeota bacterium]|nr:hypothetical protein [Calditrichota bacterium]
MQRNMILVLATVILFSISTQLSFAITFDDGATHTWDETGDWPANPIAEDVTITGANTKLIITGDDPFVMTGDFIIEAGGVLDIADGFGLGDSDPGFTLTGDIFVDGANSEFIVNWYVELDITGDIIVTSGGHVFMDGDLDLTITGDILLDDSDMETEDGIITIKGDIDLSTDSNLDIIDTEYCFVYDGANIHHYIELNEGTLTANGAEFYGSRATAGDWRGISVTGTAAGATLEMDDCEIRDAGGYYNWGAEIWSAALYIGSGSGYFKNGIIENIADPLQFSSASGIKIRDAVSNSYTAFTIEKTIITDVELNGISLWGIYSREVAGDGDKVIIKNIDISECGGDGIHANFCWPNDNEAAGDLDCGGFALSISNSRIHDNDGSGVVFDVDGNLNTEEGIEIYNVIAYDNGHDGFEIEVEGAYTNACVVIYQCTSWSNNAYGYHVKGCDAEVANNLAKWGVINCIADANTSGDLLVGCWNHGTSRCFEANPEDHFYIATDHPRDDEADDFTWHGNVTDLDGPDYWVHFENITSSPFDFHLEYTDVELPNRAINANEDDEMARWANDGWMNTILGAHDCGAWGGPSSTNWMKYNSATDVWSSQDVYRIWSDLEFEPDNLRDEVPWRLDNDDPPPRTWEMCVDWEGGNFIQVPEGDVLEISTTCVMAGTAASPIQITCTDPTENFSRIEVTSDATSCELEYVEISNADVGLKFNGTTTTSAIPIDNCTITDCGTGIYINNSEVTITDTEISGSDASSGGNAIYLTNCTAGDVTIDKCDIQDNGYDATWSSAGVYLNSSSPEIVNTLIKDNSGCGIAC